jgi:hypothetical protein
MQKTSKIGVLRILNSILVIKKSNYEFQLLVEIQIIKF